MENQINNPINGHPESGSGFNTFIHPGNSLSREDIIKGVNSLLESPNPQTNIAILEEMLEMVDEVDFLELAGLDDEKDLKNKHLLILAIEQIKKIAYENKWGLCRNNDFLYLYNGAYWNLLQTDELKAFLAVAGEKMGIDKFNARYFQFRDQLLKQFMSVSYLPKPEGKPGNILINLRNGTFEISRKGNFLRRFDRRDFLTYQLPFDFNPDAKAPMFQNFLDRVLPDKSLQDVLAEYQGSIFIHPTTLKLEKALLLYGDGANGKSVIFDILNAMLGRENVSNYSLQCLTDKDGYYRAMISNKLLNYGSEINGNLETSTFKQLVSGEPVGARLPFGNPFTVTQYAKLIFNCNGLPKDVEHTNAFFRRFLIIPFKIIIPDNEQDKELSRKIIESEMSGIFNWVLAGLNRLLTNKKFTDSEALSRQLLEYKTYSDSVKMFLDESNYVSHTHDYMMIRDLYSDYRSFCSEDGFKPVNKINFKKRLEGFGIALEKKNIGNVAFIQRKLD